ncbi:AraC family transcriptional regulator [Terriglobus roseus]|uniref:Helix-turn-helix domain-containing protein n=1 Tax=Terriglobus roseus TaxID=392734 RepID=A0A1G7H9I4_9BACT|nr:AraC family transcriptional regulator [Terriglobus roseus]SDE97046.1 Helix-turn-helix domain-containing protein [Terriglobus roseus]
MDPLAPFFERFGLSARMFYSGKQCGISPDLNEPTGYLHVLRKGTLTVFRPDAQPLVLSTPSILFFSRPQQHRVHGPEDEGADLVCATVRFGVGMLNPLTASLPEPFVVPLDTLPELAPALELLFSEANSQSSGRQVALDHLFEYVLVLLMRSALNDRLLSSGVLLGLADECLRKAIEAMHKHPEAPWSLEQLAQRAGMSRARFAARFRKIVGITPFDYLTDWRLGVAQAMLRKGSSLKLIAAAVGYANATALTRVFSKRVGKSPSDWLSERN